MQFKLIIEAIIALPRLVAELRGALSLITSVRLERELEQQKAELNILTTQLIGAETNEERRDIVRRINAL
jgi:hypothetical protein